MIDTTSEAGPPIENRYVSTAQVADALGVSVTTVKRWVDDQVLRAHRTAGGHRKLLVADVVRMVRETNLPQADLSKLIPRPQSLDLVDPQAVFAQLVLAFGRCDGEMVRALIHGAYGQGFGLDLLADRVIAPAMAHVGHQWAGGAIDVMHEHRATQMTVAALYELRSRLPAEPGRPVAVLGAPEHDHYILPSLLAELALAANGWDAVNLGPHTPASAFITGMDELKPSLVVLSVSHLTDPEGFERDYARLYEAAVARGRGGRGRGQRPNSRDERPDAGVVVRRQHGPNSSRSPAPYTSRRAGPGAAARRGRRRDPLIMFRLGPRPPRPRPGITPRRGRDGRRTPPPPCHNLSRARRLAGDVPVRAGRPLPRRRRRDRRGGRGGDRAAGVGRVNCECCA